MSQPLGAQSDCIASAHAHHGRPERNHIAHPKRGKLGHRRHSANSMKPPAQNDEVLEQFPFS